MPVRREGSIEQRVAVLETVQDRLLDLVERTDRRMERVERVIWQAVGAIVFIVITANLVVPIILESASHWHGVGAPT